MERIQGSGDIGWCVETVELPLSQQGVVCGQICQGHSTLTLPVHYSAPSQGQLVQLAVLTW